MHKRSCWIGFWKDRLYRHPGPVGIDVWRLLAYGDGSRLYPHCHAHKVSSRWWLLLSYQMSYWYETYRFTEIDRNLSLKNAFWFIDKKIRTHMIKNTPVECYAAQTTKVDARDCSIGRLGVGSFDDMECADNCWFEINALSNGHMMLNGWHWGKWHEMQAKRSTKLAMFFLIIIKLASTND